MISSYKPTLPRYYNLSFPKSRIFSNQSKEKQYIEPSKRLIKYFYKGIMNNDTELKYNYDVIKNDYKFQNVDAIVCMFYPSHCQFFIPFNKTVIFIPAHRFTIKRCSNEDVAKLIHFMFSYPDHIVVYAGGLYDREYINCYTGYSVPIIYSSSLFAYPEPQSYNPVFEEYLVAPLKHYKVRYLENMTEVCHNHNYSCSFTTIKVKLVINGDIKNYINSKQLSFSHMLYYHIISTIYIHHVFQFLFPLLNSLLSYIY